MDGAPSRPSGEEDAYQAALRSLRGAGQTVRGLQIKLERAGYHPETIARVLARLEQSGYLNDRAYAESRARRRSQGGRGSRLIAAELRQKGVSSEIIDETLRGLDRDDQLEQAVAAALKVARQHPDEAGPELRHRLEGALARRGFPVPMVREALRQVREELADPQG